MVGPVGTMLGRGAAIGVAAILLTGTIVRVHAAEGNFLEMLFGARPAQQQVPAAQPASDDRSRQAARPRMRLGAPRHKLRTRYAALPVKIRIGEKSRTSDRQVSIDMKQGAAAALLKDETLRPGDIVVLNTGARVFAGSAGKRHAMSDFEAVNSSPYVNASTRKLLSGMMTPVGALPADAARRMMARLRKAVPVADTPPVLAQTAAMRVISPWRTNP